jgi:bacteriorhodopsin
MSPIATWLLIGVLPQLVIWIWFTITAGAIFGALAVIVTGRARQPATA